MEMSIVLKNLKTGVVENVNLENFADWDGLEDRLGEDIDNNFKVEHVEASVKEVKDALYKVESLSELEELSYCINDTDDETLEAFLEIWDIETSLALLESGDYHIFRATDEEKLGQELCNEGYYNVPYELENYIDYEKLGSDYSIDANGGFTSIGFVEAI